MEERRKQNNDYLERITSVEQQVIAITDTAKVHEKNDEDRFERNFTNAKEMETRINKKLDDMLIIIRQTNRTVQILWDEKNKRDGAIGISKFVAAAVGGLFVAAVDWFIKKP